MLVGTPIDDVPSRLEFEIKPIIKNYIENYEVLYNAFYNALSNFTSERDVKFSGKANILKQPEFSTVDDVKKIISKFESKDMVNKIEETDDELKNESALGTLEELKKNKEFNSKVIVMLGIGKKHLRNYYIGDGFTDVIIKENLTDELKEKIESNL